VDVYRSGSGPLRPRRVWGRQPRAHCRTLVEHDTGSAHGVDGATEEAPGRRRRVTTTDGASADVAAHVTVDVDVAQNQKIAGTYHRVVTKADIKRALPYRVESKGAFGDIPPPGRWTLDIGADGKIVGVDPGGDTTIPFVEPYTLKGSQMRLYGPAVWSQPDPETPSLFCEPERPSDYTWHLAGSALTFTPVQKVCADRDIVFAGTWTRTD
jgi:hypothetical protein